MACVTSVTGPYIGVKGSGLNPSVKFLLLNEYYYVIISVRLLWLIAFGASLGLCGSMIHNVWIKWTEDPMTFSHNEEHLGVKTISFPMVTICPENKHNFNVNAALSSSSNLSDIE